MFFRESRHLPAIAGLIVAGVLALPALGQQILPPFSPIVSQPLAPTNLTSGDFMGRRGGATPLVLEWGQFFPTSPGLLLRPLATHFIVCLRPAAAPCSLMDHDYLESVAAPSPSLTRSGNFFRLAPAGVAIPNGQLDQALRFTVGACSALTERSCRYSIAEIYYSTRNPIADTASENGLTTPFTWTINAQATNNGDSDVPRFSGKVELFEVLGYGSPGRECVTNVDDTAIRYDSTLVVLDKFGGRTPMAMVSRGVDGRYNGPEVSGVYRLGDLSAVATFITSSPALSANQTSARGIGVVDFPIVAGVTQRTFVLVTTLDTGNVIREFNEKDNVRAKCRKR